MNVRTLCLAMLAAMLMAAAPATFAQQQGGRGNFDPAQARAQMEARMKEQLGVSDDEWKVLQPKVEKVMTSQRDARAGGFGFGGGGRRGGGGANGGGGGGGGTDNQPQSAVAKASADLRTTLQDQNASAQDINAKLTALREARAKAKGELEAAQKELKEVLTARQEAVFVSMGMLE